MSVLLLSDLHLPPVESPLREGFLAFLEGPARAASAVWLLGDLFESWAGDDVGIFDYAAEIVALRRLTRAGVEVHFLPGNRDFLVGERFAAKTGVQLDADPVTCFIGGIHTLLSHGDQWCTADSGYQLWRRFSRNPIAQKLFGALPWQTRQRIAGRLRQQSRELSSDKPPAILDVTKGAIRAAFARYRVKRIVHGHTHRPDLHRYPRDFGEVERIVLADWTPERMEYLEIADDGSFTRKLLGAMAETARE